jgi:hypothetical protein
VKDLAQPINGAELQRVAHQWRAAADQAVEEGDPAMDLWQRQAERAEREWAVFEAGRDAVLEHLPKRYVTEWWEEMMATHDKGEG